MDQAWLWQKMTTPSDALVNMMRTLQGDLMVLGAGGKMGPSLCGMAARAVARSGVQRKVYAVSRFSDAALADQLRKEGIEIIAADLTDEAQLQALPECPNVIYMVGRKFGTTGNEGATWAMNVYLPGRVAQKFSKSRIVVFSSGNIYPYQPVSSNGATPDTALEPKGEYAMTCLGRERMFGYYANRLGTPMAMYRLNYAIDLRYGVLYDIASAVWEGRPVSVAMNCFNCIWQGDANDIALRLLEHCQNPPTIFNVTGLQKVSIRETALKFGQLLDRPVQLVGDEGHKALLSDASATHEMLNTTLVSLDEMIAWVAEWVKGGGESLGKPTHFESTDGKY